jgi:iron-sulfur cluster assembly accessory protein
MTVEKYNPDEISFEITKEAKQQLKKFSQNNEIFFLTVKKMGCSGYAYDLRQEQKQNIKDNFLKVDNEIDFYVDSNYKNLLNNIVMKWDDTSSFQKNFVFENPNVKNTCGCGESFTDE